MIPTLRNSNTQYPIPWIRHSCDLTGTILEEKLFAEFDEFVARTTEENSESEFDTEEPPLKKITFNTDYKIKTFLEEPPTDLELKPLPDNLEYAFLEEPFFLPVIISSQLSEENKNKLVFVLKNHKQAFAWKTTDIPGICPSFSSRKVTQQNEIPQNSIQVFVKSLTSGAIDLNGAIPNIQRQQDTSRGR
ncbi:hypothetical protein Tco_0373352 [Tanacetum coccineum]